ncbi:MAG TPA: glutamine--fructose-6-phosphate transaminase (isomerizing) [Syntrophorhabdaceae bacterium]|nr:glutamine--fructose-6-phosphate transaminase (isomerizing) [Syntrophorhabdaceae bacterium]HQM81080.1 glutamine--fructose-6-phosphate transaminase (isomerizing) [Syntrophorhabdaceae bacterium]
MCGIVGYKGKDDACGILIDALKRLEYRGYDSAGIAVWNQGRIEIARKKGKVDELRKVVADGDFSGRTGIAHTRWATHGTPSERNAHPHKAGDVVVVHNGIIENYIELKERLRKEGHKFLSDTDTEVIPHLITSYIGKGRDFAEAVRLSLKELRGSYALGIIREKDNTLIAARKESPLIVGVGNGEYFIASDAPAIINRTKRFIFLEDDDIVIFEDGGMRLIDLEGKPVKREIRQVQWSDAMAEKGGFKHFMLKEIFEQPRAVSETLIGRVKEERGQVDFEELRLPDLTKIKKIWMVACGTSYHACLIGKHLFESLLRIPVETDIASEFRYREPILKKDEMLVLVSQSGETADTIAAMKEGKKRGVYTLSVCNVLGSTLARDADGVIFTHAGPEIGVASTKAFTTQISVLFLLMLHMGKGLGKMAGEEISRYIKEIKQIPRKVQSILDAAASIEEMARRYMSCKDFLYLARGINYPSALEGALKLKEISYIHAEAYAAGEMKHGPIALIDENMPVVVVSPNDHTYKKTCGNVEEVISRRGRVILFTDDERHEMADRVESCFVLPRTIYGLQPILSVVPLQLLAYHIANFLGTDVDQPRNLAKSVTVE